MSDDPTIDLPFEGVFEVIAFDADSVTILAQRLFNRDKQRLDVPRHYVKDNNLELKRGSYGRISIRSSENTGVTYNVRLTGEVGEDGKQPRL